jgi:hypothetical protein
LWRWHLPFFPLVALDWIVGLRFAVCRLVMLLMRAHASDRCFSGNRAIALAFLAVGPRNSNRLPAAYIRGANAVEVPLLD